MNVQPQKVLADAFYLYLAMRKRSLVSANTKWTGGKSIYRNFPDSNRKFISTEAIKLDQLAMFLAASAPAELGGMPSLFMAREVSPQ
jgi:hypothetical protein